MKKLNLILLPLSISIFSLITAANKDSSLAQTHNSTPVHNTKSHEQFIKKIAEERKKEEERRIAIKALADILEKSSPEFTKKAKQEVWMDYLDKLLENQNSYAAMTIFQTLCTNPDGNNNFSLPSCIEVCKILSKSEFCQALECTKNKKYWAENPGKCYNLNQDNLKLPEGYKVTGAPFMIVKPLNDGPWEFKKEIVPNIEEAFTKISTPDSYGQYLNFPACVECQFNASTKILNCKCLTAKEESGLAYVSSNITLHPGENDLEIDILDEGHLRHTK